MRPREQLNPFFGEFLKILRQTPLADYIIPMQRAEEEFRHFGWRENNSGGGY